MTIRKGNSKYTIKKNEKMALIAWNKELSQRKFQSGIIRNGYWPSFEIRDSEVYNWAADWVAPLGHLTIKPKSIRRKLRFFFNGSICRASTHSFIINTASANCCSIYTWSFWMVRLFSLPNTNLLTPSTSNSLSVFSLISWPLCSRPIISW